MPFHLPNTSSSSDAWSDARTREEGHVSYAHCVTLYPTLVHAADAQGGSHRLVMVCPCAPRPALVHVAAIPRKSHHGAQGGLHWWLMVSPCVPSQHAATVPPSGPTVLSPHHYALKYAVPLPPHISAVALPPRYPPPSRRPIPPTAIAAPSPTTVYVKLYADKFPKPHPPPPSTSMPSHSQPGANKYAPHRCFNALRSHGPNVPPPPDLCQAPRRRCRIAYASTASLCHLPLNVLCRRRVPMSL
jgi:hypothetical protein